MRLTSSSFRKIIICLLISFLTVIIAPWSYAQDILFKTIYTQPQLSIIVAQDANSETSEEEETSTEETEESSEEEVKEAPVLVDGTEIFTIKTRLGEFSPEDRAKEITDKIKKVAEDDTIFPDSIRVVNFKALELIQTDDVVIAVFGEEDAEADNLPLSQLVIERVDQIKQGIIDYRELRTKPSISRGIVKTIIATIVAVISLYLLNKVLPNIFNKIRGWQRQRLESVEFQGLQFISGRQVAKFISFLFTLTRIFLIFLVFYIYLPLVLSSFPWTKPIGIKLQSYFWNSVNLVLNGIIAYLPNVFIIAVISIFSYYSIRFARLFFSAIGRERITINGFYPEWAEPTYNLIMFLIIALAGVLIFPYLPASNSAGFQGISIFAGCC